MLEKLSSGSESVYLYKADHDIELKTEISIQINPWPTEKKWWTAYPTADAVLGVTMRETEFLLMFPSKNLQLPPGEETGHLGYAVWLVQSFVNVRREWDQEKEVEERVWEEG